MKELTCLMCALLTSMAALPVQAQTSTKLEAENAAYVHCRLITDASYSGGKALELTESNAQITFTFNATVKGKYTVYAGYDGLYGDKVAVLTTNTGSGTFVTKGHGETAVGTFFMSQGANTIVVTPSWTWFRIDYIRIVRSESTLTFDIAPTPTDGQATAAAREMYAFLYDNFWKKTISGIMTGDMASANGNITQHDDVKAVYQASGKHPALVGFDFMNSTGAQANNGWTQDYTNAVVSLATDLYARGGLPNFTWHWRDPSRRTWEFYTDKCSMKISDALKPDGSWNTASALYRNIIDDIDTVAKLFLKLQDAGVACIFRPLHEASGGWFWWGREGAAPYLKLYHLLYDEMVVVKGVHNIIWVWNAGEQDAEWNPGEDYFDVVSADIYNADFDYSSNYVLFDKLKELTGGKKIIALSENGPVPDMGKEADEEAVWSWWMPWYQTWGGNFVNKTSREQWRKVMNDSRVITLEDRSAGWNTYSGISPQLNTTHDCHSIYDLQGRRLDCAPLKGVYIKDRKTLVCHK